MVGNTPQHCRAFELLLCRGKLREGFEREGDVPLITNLDLEVETLPVERGGVLKLSFQSRYIPQSFQPPGCVLLVALLAEPAKPLRP